MTALMASRRKAADRKERRKQKAARIGTKKPSHSKLVQKADRLFSLIVRSVGRCESGRPNHAGPLQCAHLWSRRYEGTRWLRRNAVCLCAGCHVFFTHRPIEWDEWMRARFHPLDYEATRRLALTGGKQDMDRVLSELENEHKVLGEAA